MKRSRLDDLIMEEEHLSCLDRDILDRIRLKKLNALLQKEKERNGFYSSLPSSLSSLKELSLLPFTSDEDLRSQYTRMFLGSSADIARVMSEKTSGTTGQAKRVFYTARDLDHTIRFFAAGIGEMAESGETVMIGMPYAGPGSLGDLIAGGTEGCGAVPVQLLPGTLHQQCLQYHECQPGCAIDMPAVLLARARYYESVFGKGSFPLRKALISGDTASKEVEQALREEFRLTLYPHYGSREMCMGGAITCQAFEGMHLREHQIIGEIIDENGNVLEDGQWGELVITTIDMEALPLIRYRTGDHARFLKEPCPCGSVTGRLDRITRITEENSLMEQLDDCLMKYPQVLDVRAAMDHEVLDAEVLVLAGTGEEELRRAFVSCFGAAAGQFSLHMADNSSNLLHAGKRKVSVR